MRTVPENTFTTDYDWDTHFDHVAHTMTHTFSDQLQVVVYLKGGMISVLKNGQVVNRFPFTDDYTMEMHYWFLLRVAEGALCLESLKMNAE